MIYVSQEKFPDTLNIQFEQNLLFQSQEDGQLLPKSYELNGIILPKQLTVREFEAL